MREEDRNRKASAVLNDVELEPSYYRAFSCIADRCSLTCCQEWRIEMDEAACLRWKDRQVDGRSLRESLRREADGQYRLQFGEDHVCTWLNGQGLCRIVLEAGEEMLCETCHTFPRQEIIRESGGRGDGCVPEEERESEKPELYVREEPSERSERHCRGKRVERGLRNSCPEVLNLLQSEGSFRVCRREHTETEDSGRPGKRMSADGLTSMNVLDEDDRLTPQALTIVRDGICRLLSDEMLTVEEGLITGLVLLRDLWEVEADPEEALEQIRTLTDPAEYRPEAEEVRQILRAESSPELTLQEERELFLDLCENYRRENRYPRVLEPLCQRAEQEENAEIPKAEKKEEEEKAEREEKADAASRGDCGTFFHALAASECWNSLLAEDTDLEGLILNYQWILMEFAAVRYGLTVIRELSAEKTPICPDRSDMICVILRMMSCPDREKARYLKSMFEEPLWEPGYALLLLGAQIPPLSSD